LKNHQASVFRLPERIEFIDCLPFAGAEKVDNKPLIEEIEKKIQAGQ